MQSESKAHIHETTYQCATNLSTNLTNIFENYAVLMIFDILFVKQQSENF